MSKKPNIKVIKRTDAVRKPKVAAIPTSRQTAREMVSTISEWVTEVKDRKTEETKAAMDLLFSVNGQPSES
jgi:hypothetical protein